VLVYRQMLGSHAFGDLHVGTVLDSFALPGHEPAVARLARTLCADRGVDLSLTNQLHVAWQHAFRAAGYLSGPSNFLVAASPALHAAAGEGDRLARVHLTRGDGDGRINLM
jgi:hypothetical protein